MEPITYHLNKNESISRKATPVYEIGNYHPSKFVCGPMIKNIQVTVVFSTGITIIKHIENYNWGKDNNHTSTYYTYDSLDIHTLDSFVVLNDFDSLMNALPQNIQDVIIFNIDDLGEML